MENHQRKTEYVEFWSLYERLNTLTEWGFSNRNTVAERKWPLSGNRWTERLPRRRRPCRD